MSTANGTMFFNQASGTGTFGSASVAFRTWGQQVSAALQAVGLVQTTDTGQVNWSTVSAPAGTATYAGYEIYRFADTLQATRPVFIKVEYGSGSSTAAQASIRISVSTSTTGAGTLNGTLVSNTLTIMGVTATESQPQPYFFCGDTSSVVFAISTGNASGGFRPSVYMIERSRNSDGTPNGDGLAFSSNQGYGAFTGSAYGQGGTIVQSYLTTSQSGTWRFLPIASPSAHGWWDQAGQDGSATNFFPYLIATPKQEAQMLSILGSYAYAFPALTTTTVVVNGSTHTYLSLGAQNYVESLPGSGGANGFSSSGYGANTATCSLLMRYE